MLSLKVDLSACTPLLLTLSWDEMRREGLQERARPCVITSLLHCYLLERL